MSIQESSSLQPVLNLAIPDLARTAFITSWEHTARHAKIVSAVRSQKFWDLRRFEYQHFYSAWAGIAFRVRACAQHSAEYAEAFRQPVNGTNADLALFAQDEALFGFFVKGLSVLECWCYGLYALCALATSAPPEYTVSSNAFPLLDPQRPERMQHITVVSSLQALETHYRGASITTSLQALTQDGTYHEWKRIRNVFAHCAATAGRDLVYHGLPSLGFSGRPASIRQWAGEVPLTERTTTANYAWLVPAINRLLEETSRFTAQVFAPDETADGVAAPE